MIIAWTACRALGADGGWQPGIGDPTWGGWLTVAAYFVASWLCARCAAQAPLSPAPRPRATWFWILLAVLLVLAGINKQLDLQSWFTELARDVALEQGWYESRRRFQAVFVGTLLALVVAAMSALFWLSRSWMGSARTALLGVFALGAFVVVRAASFHHLDRFIGTTVLGLRVNWILEFGGISIIALAAWMQASRSGAGVRGSPGEAGRRN